MKKYVAMLIFLTLTAWTGSVSAYDTHGVNIHGFISQGYIQSDTYNYLATDTKDGSFEYNEMGINFSKVLTDKLRIGVQLFSRDIGDAANNKVTLDWAYADYRWRDWLGLRVGRIKLPMGLYNETRDMDMLRTSIVLPQGIYSDLARDNLIAINGVSLYGNVNMKSGGGLEYQLLAGTFNADKDSGVGKYTVNSFGGSATVSGEIRNDTAYAGALRWDTPLKGFRLGYSIFNEPAVEIPLNISVNLGGGVTGNMAATIEGSGLVQVYSAEYTWHELILAIEYMIKENDGTVLGYSTSKTAECYYLSASYRFSDLFTLGAYYSEYFPNRDDKSGDDLTVDHGAWEKDLALTLRFDINEYWIFKIEGHSVDGTANVLATDNSGNDFSNSNWYYGAAKVTFNF